MNDEERRMWILNDESLYSWWKKTRPGRKSGDNERGLMTWIRGHRDEIDRSIRRLDK